VGKEGGVCEVLQVPGIVRHDVGSPWEEVRQVAVAVLALMGAVVVAKVCGQPIVGNSALGDARHCWGVVRSVG
jgi:hypothetical protein